MPPPRPARTLARNARQHVTGHFGIETQVKLTRQAGRIMGKKKHTG